MLQIEKFICSGFWNVPTNTHLDYISKYLLDFSNLSCHLVFADQGHRHDHLSVAGWGLFARQSHLPGHLVRSRHLIYIHFLQQRTMITTCWVRDIVHSKIALLKIWDLRWDIKHEGSRSKCFRLKSSFVVDFAICIQKMTNLNMYSMILLYGEKWLQPKPLNRMGWKFVDR